MDNKKKDYLLHTLLFQFLVCGITFGILFGIKFTGSGVLDNIKSAYFDNLERNFIVELKDSGSEVFKNTHYFASFFVCLSAFFTAAFFAFTSS